MMEDKRIAELPLWKTLLTWIIRLFVGGVFIFSGFTKSVDVWGTLFKIEDYLSVLDIPVRFSLISLSSFILCMSEFLLGVFLVLGCFRKVIPYLIAIVMAFMLPLTLWIALFNPVPDCGCFGDFLIISNWGTFIKNVLLCCGVVWLILYNRKIHWILTPSVQWICFVSSGIFIFCICIIGYLDQPLIDFRPYKIGMKISDYHEEDYEPEYVFIYEKNGEKKEFKEDEDLPNEEDGWTFIERRELRIAPKNSKTDISGLSVINLEDNSTVPTSEVISPSGAEFLLLFPSLNSLSIASSYKINSLYAWCEKNNVKMVAISGSGRDEVTHWKDISMAQYPIYGMDESTVSMIARGNPALVYLEDGEIKWKRALKAIPVDDFIEDSDLTDPMIYYVDNSIRLRNICMVYLTVLGVLIVLSFLPVLKNCFFRKSSGKKDHS